MGEPLKIVSWNTNGFWHKRRGVLRHLRELGADVALLQETHVGPQRGEPPGTTKVTDLGRAYEWAAFTVYQPSSRGVAVLIRRGLACGGLRIVGDEGGRYLALSCALRGEDYTFVSVYNAGEEGAPLAAIRPGPGTLVVGGDFNTALDGDLDRTSAAPNRGHRRRRRGLAAFLRSLQLVDVWRALHPEGRSYTYADRAQNRSRLDYIFVPGPALRRVAGCTVHGRPPGPGGGGGGFLSDHAPVSLWLLPAGPPAWRLDPALLLRGAGGEEGFLDRARAVIGGFSRRKGAETWRGLKCRLRCEAIDFLRQTQTPGLTGPGTQTPGLTGPGTQTPGLTGPESQTPGLTGPGTQTPGLTGPESQTPGLTGPGTQTPGLTGPESQTPGLTGPGTQTPGLTGPGTQTPGLTGPGSQTPVHRPSTASSSSHPRPPGPSAELDDYLDHLRRAGAADDLRSAVAAVLTDPVSQQEVLLAIRALEDPEAPAPDGFPVRFYRALACPLAAYLQALFNDALGRQVVPEWLSEAVALKQEESCRPISCFNVDYKIFSSILARRLNSVLRHVLGPEGQPRPRDCARAVRRAWESGPPALVVTLRLRPHGVKWPYLSQRLKAAGLPPAFRLLLQRLVTRRAPGGPSEPGPARGLRQGCPLTPPLLGLCAEPLARAVRADERIAGLGEAGGGGGGGGGPLKARAAEGGVVVYMARPTPGAAAALLETAADFALNSGAEVDDGSSEVLGVGVPRPPDGSVLGGLRWLPYRGALAGAEERARLKRDLAALREGLGSELEAWAGERAAKRARLVWERHLLPRFLPLLRTSPALAGREPCEEIERMIAAFVGDPGDPGLPHLYCCALLAHIGDHEE